eukprot:831545-Rhodomonas_salina.2
MCARRGSSGAARCWSCALSVARRPGLGQASHAARYDQALPGLLASSSLPLHAPSLAALLSSACAALSSLRGQRGPPCSHQHALPSVTQVSPRFRPPWYGQPSPRAQ